MAGQLSAARMPRGIKVSLVLVWFQAVGNTLYGGLLLALAADVREHGGSRGAGSGLLTLLGCVDIAVGLLLVVCAALAPRGPAWVRPTVIGVEALIIADSVVMVFSGGTPVLLVGLAVACGIIRQLTLPDGRSWFGRR